MSNRAFIDSGIAGTSVANAPRRRRNAPPMRQEENGPSPAADRVVELLTQRKALMAVAMRVGQDHEATHTLLDQVFDIDQELGAAALSSREGAVAALRYVQDQYLGDRHNEPLCIGDAAVLHLLGELGEFICAR